MFFEISILQQGYQRKFMLKCSLGFILLMILFSCSVVKPKATSMSFADNPVIAHRGAFKKNGLPENSIASLKEAIRLGCTGSEFDVRMTGDDSLIIMHDPHYQKMNIETSTYSELAQMPLSNGEKLPTLREYLQAGLTNNRQTKLVVEIKPSPTGKERGQRIAEKVIALVRELNATQMVAYISFDYDILKKIRVLDAAAETQYLNGDRTPEQLKEDGITGADYHFSVFRKNENWITMAHQLNLVLNAWTVNTKQDMEWFLSQRFNYITTDEPEMLLEVWQTVKGMKK